MHAAAMDWVKKAKAQYPDSFKGKRVLEVGSRYINGTVRTLFEGCDYTGLDLSPGPCVDLVCHVADLDKVQILSRTFESRILPSTFQVVISCEALEHDKRWDESLGAMYDLLVPGGLLIITAGGTGRPEHGTTATSPSDSPATTDYYGNITEEKFWSVLEPSDFVNLYEIEDKDGDFRFMGRKA